MVSFTKPLALAALALAPLTGLAGGYALIEVDAGGLGQAYAGSAAAATDASTIAHNPAGMTTLQGRHFSGGAIVGFPRVRFETGGRPPVVGPELHGGNAASPVGVPSLYYVDHLAHGARFGVALTVPAGARLEPGTGWTGRYYATESRIEAINVSPAIALPLGPHTSGGLALDLHYVRARMAKAIDFGTACRAFLAEGPCASRALFPRRSDGLVAAEGSDVALGYHLGIQHAVSEATRVGAQFRSKVTYRLSGDARFSGVPAMFTTDFPSSRIRADLTLPEVLTFSATHAFSSKLTLMADAAWTRWSRMDIFTIHFDRPPLTGPDVTVDNWKDTWRFALGFNHRLADHVLLRAGVAYDQDPIRPGRRTPALPDAARRTLSLGINYRLAPLRSVDIGYAHVTLQTASVDLQSPGQGSLIGHYRSRMDLLGVQYNLAF
ncbi:OmpP1/FadL family transporter [Variovorax sp. J31P216]|nr:OmpP1/FadL family transporter [Variovorax sp. J31P216]